MSTTVPQTGNALRKRILDEDGVPEGKLRGYADGWLKDLFVHMLRVRCVDQRMLKLQRAGRIGFVGSMLGQEAAMIGTATALEPRDWLWSGLREGGAALMRGLPLAEYVAQMYCNSNDTAKGRQMCNHFQHKGSHYPSWSSVIGTQVLHGVGAAYAAKLKKLDTAQIAPMAAFLASDAAAEVTSQIFAVRGNEIFLMSQPRPVRGMHTAEGWTPETIAERVLPAMKPNFFPLESSNIVFSWDPV